ncbi:hypothetical protein KJ359_008163 [Pestalotiopsis sp. 9143b]|nr:hypothetical protein KJ359_008163 [Pestalotiopsis sp. 9143b]
MRFVTVASISLAATGATASSSTPAEARTDCAGTLGCIAGTQYCSLNNGQLINLHTACTGAEDDGSEGDDDDDWKRAVDARADCAGSIGCIAGTQYCSYNGQLTSLHITCGDNWEGGDDGDNWKRDIAARVDCPGSLGCIAGTQYCSYNNGSLISLHTACGENWEGGDDGDDGDNWKRSEEGKAKRYTCSGSIGCVAGTEYCSYGDNNGWHWDNMGTPCQAGDAPIYVTDDNDSDTWTGTHTRTRTGADAQSTTSWTTVAAAPTTSVTVITTTPSGASAASTITSSAVVTPTIVAAVTGTTKATTTSSSSVSKAGAPRATAAAGILAGVAVAAVFL